MGDTDDDGKLGHQEMLEELFFHEERDAEEERNGTGPYSGSSSGNGSTSTSTHTQKDELLTKEEEEELVRAAEEAREARVERAIGYSKGYKAKLKELREARPGSQHFKSLSTLRKSSSVQ